MPLAITRSNFPGAGSAIEASIVGSEEGGGTDSVELLVPPRAEVLIVTLTDEGPTGFLRGPTRTEISVVDPQGKQRSDLIRRGAAGQYTLVTQQPAEGRWTVTITHAPGASAELNTAVYAPDAPTRLVRLGRFVKCKACKFLLKAALVALLVHLAPFLAAGLGLGPALAQVAATAGAVLAAIQKVLGVAYEGLKALLEFIEVSIDDPIDTQLGRLCRVTKLCDA